MILPVETSLRNSWPKSGLDPEGIADGSRGFAREGTPPVSFACECFRSRRRSQITSAVRCDPFRINNLACDNNRWCRFAQPPATFYNPYRGNEAMMRENEVFDLLRNAWGRVIDRGAIDWIVSNRSIETKNARPDERQPSPSGRQNGF